MHDWVNITAVLALLIIDGVIQRRIGYAKGRTSVFEELREMTLSAAVEGSDEHR